MIYRLRVAVSQALIWCLDRTIPRGDGYDVFMECLHDAAQRGWRRTAPTRLVLGDDDQ